MSDYVTGASINGLMNNLNGDEQQQQQQQKNKAQENKEKLMRELELRRQKEQEEERKTKEQEEAKTILEDEKNEEPLQPNSPTPTMSQDTTPSVINDMLQTRKRKKRNRMVDTHTPKTIHIRNELIYAIDLVCDWGDKYRMVDMGIMTVLLTDPIFSKRLKSEAPDLYERINEIWNNEHY